MSSLLRTSLANAQRIIRCTEEILVSGISTRCQTCPVAACRRQLARYVPPGAAELRPPQ